MGLSWPGCYAPHYKEPGMSEAYDVFSDTHRTFSSMILDLFKGLWSLFGIFAAMHICLLAPWVWQSILLLLIFLPTIGIIGSPTPFWKRVRKQVTRRLWRTKKPFWRRRLEYHLVMRCCRRIGNRPTTLPSTSCPSQRSHT